MNLITRKIFLPLGEEEKSVAAEPVVILDSEGNIQAPGTVEFTSDPENPLYITSDSPISITSPFNQFSEEEVVAEATTSSLDVSIYSKITCQYTVSSISTNTVFVRLEGSCDGNNWFNLDPSETDTEITSNGTYAFIINDVSLFRIRFNFVSETGTPLATIAVRMVAS